MCICVCACVGTHTPWHTHGAQKIAFKCLLISYYVHPGLNPGPQLCQEPLPTGPSTGSLIPLSFARIPWEYFTYFTYRRVGIHPLPLGRALTENKCDCLWLGKKNLGPSVPSSYSERLMLIKTAESLSFHAGQSCFPASINLWLKQAFFFKYTMKARSNPHTKYSHTVRISKKSTGDGGWQEAR